MNIKRRIIRPDQYSWAIQELQPAGHVASRGRTAGEATTEDKWKAANSFHNRLRHAALSMLDDTIGDETSEVVGSDVIAAIERAEESVTEYLSGLLDAMNTDTLIGILQERGFDVKERNGKRGRKSYVDDE